MSMSAVLKAAGLERAPRASSRAFYLKDSKDPPFK